MKAYLFTNENGQRFILPFFLIASLFLLSGYTNSLLDVLNKYFQESLHISRAQSGLVQFALYSGYFLMALPAGILLKKWGFNKGIVTGLFVLVGGSLLFIPGAYYKSFFIFLIALFIIACGFTFFETAANPLATFLGSKKGAERRINLAQSFNGVGWILGPLLGGLIIFSEGETEVTNFKNLPVPFIILSSLVLLIAIFLLRNPLPNIQTISEEKVKHETPARPLLSYRHLIWAVIAQFFYTASQTGVNSFFINYATETDSAMSNQQAAVLLSFGGMGLFVLGRFTGSYFLKWIKAHKLLAIYAAAGSILMLIVVLSLGKISIIALIATYFFMSIMYPTIFALGIKDLGGQVPRASSLLVMAIVGGALCPMLMGYIADISSMPVGFVVPLAGFTIILLFGLFGYKVRS